MRSGAVTYRGNWISWVLFTAFSAILRETNRGEDSKPIPRAKSVMRKSILDEHKLLPSFEASSVSFFYSLTCWDTLRDIGIARVRLRLAGSHIRFLSYINLLGPLLETFPAGDGHGGRISPGGRERAAMQARALSGTTLATLRPHSQWICGDPFAQRHPCVRSVFRSSTPCAGHADVIRFISVCERRIAPSFFDRCWCSRWISR